MKLFVAGLPYDFDDVDLKEMFELYGTVNFAKIVMDAGYASPIRTPRGRDILAACGQLKTDSERRKKAGALPLDPAGDKSPDPIT